MLSSNLRQILPRKPCVFISVLMRTTCPTLHVFLTWNFFFRNIFNYDSHINSQAVFIGTPHLRTDSTDSGANLMLYGTYCTAPCLFNL